MDPALPGRGAPDAGVPSENPLPQDVAALAALAALAPRAAPRGPSLGPQPAVQPRRRRRSHIFIPRLYLRPCDVPSDLFAGVCVPLGLSRLSPPQAHPRRARPWPAASEVSRPRWGLGLLSAVLMFSSGFSQLCPSVRGACHFSLFFVSRRSVQFGFQNDTPFTTLAGKRSPFRVSGVKERSSGVLLP